MAPKITRLIGLLGLLLLVGASLPAAGQPAAVEASSTLAASTQLQQPPGSTRPGAVEIQADEFDAPLSDHEVAGRYDKPAVYLQDGDTISFTATIETEGPYTVKLDVATPDTFIIPPEGQLQVDGDFPAPDLQRFIIPIYYQNVADEFPLDRYGNEALVRQEPLVRWTTLVLRDANFSQRYPLQIQLTPGEHTFAFTLTRETLLLGSVYLEPFVAYPAYPEYVQAVDAPDATDVLIELEAEWPSYKDNTAINPVNSRSLSVTPYETEQLVLNTLGGENWELSGSTVYYEFEVPQSGMYHITLRALQDTKDNFTVFRRFTVNGEIPFDELNTVPFGYTTDWENVTLGGEGGPFRIYLEEGVNVLGIQATNAPYNSAIQKIQAVLLDINELSLEINRLTGNQIDPFKDWVISDYIPDIEQRLRSIAADLQTDLDILRAIQGSGGSQEIMTYELAIENILELADDPDEIPARMTRFSQGSGSAAQLLATLLPGLQSQPLALDKIFVHSPDVAAPESEVSLWRSISEGVKRFLLSFRPNPYQSIGVTATGELEVWVNRPRQYVDLLQSITDERFTGETGIQVKYSIMPDESKLILANAARITPDVALGVSTNQPYELAIRGALKDLRSFPDFDAFINIYKPGALLSYVINDSVYALPETQDFWVTFYRRDIMESLGIPIPDTWDEVIEILPELQRVGMNFNTPLSGGAGVKGYLLTAPYIFNHGADLYQEQGFTGLASDNAIEAIQFMAESFTIYGMPLQVGNFYDDFRYGRMPIGIANFTTYLQLMTAAPELNGLWGMTPYPATVLEDGRELRYATGSAQASVMFERTEHPEEAWEFLKWWMSTETQIDFQQQLILNYGFEYLWNSANVEAFAASPVPDEHKEIILAQWEWMQEPVKLPGSYMQERELSNAWNRIVFDGVNPRVAIDSAIITINREIARKMEEFGYMEDGVIVREFFIPDIETIERWMEEGG